MKSRDGKNILVIEDELELLELIAGILKAEGYRVTASSNPYTAMEMAQAGGYDLIISDNYMPEFSGLQIFWSLRKMGIVAPFMLMTGAVDVDEGQFDGISAIVSKPTPVPILLEKIKDTIAKI